MLFKPMKSNNEYTQNPNELKNINFKYLQNTFVEWKEQVSFDIFEWRVHFTYHSKSVANCQPAQMIAKGERQKKKFFFLVTNHHNIIVITCLIYEPCNDQEGI